MVGAALTPACATANGGCNGHGPPRPAPAGEGYAGQAAREPPVDLVACRAGGPLSGTIVLDRGGGRMPAGRLLRRAHAREAVVQPAFDRIAVDVEHPQLVVGHDFVQAVLGLLAVRVQADALAGFPDGPGAGDVVGGAVALPVQIGRAHV